MQSDQEGLNPFEAHLMSAQDTSSWLGLPVFTIYSWAQMGKIPHYKLGKRVMFCKGDLTEWLKTHRRSSAN